MKTDLQQEWILLPLKWMGKFPILGGKQFRTDIIVLPRRSLKQTHRLHERNNQIKFNDLCYTAGNYWIITTLLTGLSIQHIYGIRTICSVLPASEDALDFSPLCWSSVLRHPDALLTSHNFTLLSALRKRFAYIREIVCTLLQWLSLTNPLGTASEPATILN